METCFCLSVKRGGDGAVDETHAFGVRDLGFNPVRQFWEVIIQIPNHFR